MCSLIKDKTTDKRKNQRDLKAVIGDGIIYAICALGISYVLSFWLLLLVYILEMIYVALGYLHIFQTAKWTKIQKAEKKKRVLVLGKKEHNRDTFYILYGICNVYYIV